VKYEMNIRVEVRQTDQGSHYGGAAVPIATPPSESCRPIFPLP